jgi:hypothetical protein
VRHLRAIATLEAPPRARSVAAMGHSSWLPPGATIEVRENRESACHFVIELAGNGGSLATPVVFGPDAGHAWMSIVAGAWEMARLSAAYESEHGERR